MPVVVSHGPVDAQHLGEVLRPEVVGVGPPTLGPGWPARAPLC